MPIPVPPVPSNKEPITDPKTGRISTNWYRFFQALAQRLNESA